MPITVNTNIASLNAQRNLNRSSTALAKSLERLSSGLRINRAGDDAAGLSISEGLRSQIRGLNQAVRNANDGVSMISTAESAIASYTSILQRIRELAVQSANDTNSADNRRALNEESIQLIEEMSRIATTVDFNGTKLLDGSFVSKQLQVGANVNETVTIATGDLRTSVIGAVATVTSGPVTAALTAGDLSINGVGIDATANDGVSYNNPPVADPAASAIAIARVINAQTNEMGVRAEAQAAVMTGGFTIAGGVGIDATNTLVINGVTIGAAVVQANDSDSALRNAINESTNTTGVVASLDATNKLVLTAADGRNITVETTGGDGADTGIGEGLGLVALTGGDGEQNLSPTTTGGTIKLTSDNSFSVGGTSKADAGLAAVTSVSIDFNTAISQLSLTNVAGANSAIEIMDNALRQVSEVRSGLGAITNRLELTIQSLQTAAENLSASDSRIRDADFAVETANLTKNQILQQAGVLILAQANTTTQAALQLLQG